MKQIASVTWGKQVEASRSLEIGLRKHADVSANS